MQEEHGIPEAAMFVPKRKSSHTLTAKPSASSRICQKWLGTRTQSLPERFKHNVHVMGCHGVVHKRGMHHQGYLHPNFFRVAASSTVLICPTPTARLASLGTICHPMGESCEQVGLSSMLLYFQSAM